MKIFKHEFNIKQWELQVWYKSTTDLTEMAFKPNQSLKTNKEYSTMTLTDSEWIQYAFKIGIEVLSMWIQKTSRKIK